MKSLDTVEREILERIYLDETIAILFDYDGFSTVESLKGLIDETMARLRKLQLHEVTREDIFGPNYTVTEIDL